MTQCKVSKIMKEKTSERGIALLLALFALLLVTLLGLAMTTQAIIEMSISANERHATETLYVAEAGAVHAQGIIFNQNPDFTTVLQAGDGNSCTGDELATGVTDPITSIAGGAMALEPMPAMKFACAMIRTKRIATPMWTQIFA